VNEEFKKSFLNYVLEGHDEELAPYCFIKSDGINDLLRAAFATIVYHPSEMYVKSFYEHNILPAELKLGNTLEQDELNSIKDLFTDPLFLEQFISGMGNAEKQAYITSVSEGLSDLCSGKNLSGLEVEVPGLTDKMKKADQENPVWNWLKKSPQKDTDKFLKVYSSIRESWVTQDFSKAPKLRHTLKKSIKRSIISFRITSASYKKHLAAAGSKGKLVTRSANGYVKFVKGRMLDKEKWLKNADGTTLGSTPVNLNMMYSAIGLVASIQGVHSFFQKAEKGKADIDAYVNLFKSLSSGASSFMGLMPDCISKSYLTKALGNVFALPGAICDINDVIKLISKAQLFYAQENIEKTIFTSVQAGIKLTSAGISISSFFRFKALTKLLIRKEMLVQGASKALGISIAFATVGCEVVNWYLKHIAPEGVEISASLVKENIDNFINDDPRKKIDKVEVDHEGYKFKVPKINYFDADLKWKDAKIFNDKEIYCDPDITWDWLRLKDLIEEKIAGVPAVNLKGMGWVSKFDEEKVLYDLVDRGVPTYLVGKIIKKDETEVENHYRRVFREHQTKLLEDSKFLSSQDKESMIKQIIS